MGWISSRVWRFNDIQNFTTSFFLVLQIFGCLHLKWIQLPCCKFFLYKLDIVAHTFPAKSRPNKLFLSLILTNWQGKLKFTMVASYFIAELHIVIWVWNCFCSPLDFITFLCLPFQLLCVSLLHRAALLSCSLYWYLVMIN